MSCTPLPACPASWRAGITLSEDFPGPDTWDGHSGGILDPNKTVEVMGGVGDCKTYQRLDTTCDGVAQYKHCNYHDSDELDCAGFPPLGGASCTPVPECPASWGPGIVLNSEPEVNAMYNWTNLGLDPAAIEVRTDENPDNTGGCNVKVRAATSCNGSSQLRECIYGNSANTGCTASTTPPACPNRGTTFKLALDTEMNNWTGLGGNSTATEQYSLTPGTPGQCVLHIRTDTSTQTHRRCAYENYYPDLGCNYGGDANCDGVVNATDPTVTGDYVIGLNPSPACPDRMDVNKSGSVTAVDAMIIQMIIAGTYPPAGW